MTQHPRSWARSSVGRVLPPLHLRPAQAAVAGFAAADLVGTALLMLPMARVGPGGAPFITALFTSTSAVCVTGLSVVDTATYWTGFGQAVILALIQIGGFGIMTFAAIVGVFFARRMGLRARLTAASEAHATGLGDVRAVLRGVALVTVAVEVTIAALLTARFAFGYRQSAGEALWNGVFHSVSAFNNAGFALFSANLMDFARDPWILLPICVAVVLGGLGFPVLLEIARHGRARRIRRRAGDRSRAVWSMNTRLVLGTTAVLLVAGTVFIGLTEWRNPGTLGPLPVADKLVNAFTASVMPRTAGFNSVNIGAMHPDTLFGTDVLMFIGGASASTAGGIKVTTFAVLFFVIYSEIRGESDVNIGNRRIPRSMQRQALAVAALGALVMGSATVLMLSITDLDLDPVLFEVVSAAATVGLSTGITPSLPASAQLILVALMFVGRLGPAVLASALVLRSRHRRYELPVERPIIG